jgi:hypothetical protein
MCPTLVALENALGSSFVISSNLCLLALLIGTAPHEFVAAYKKQGFSRAGCQAGVLFEFRRLVASSCAGTSSLLSGSGLGSFLALAVLVFLHPYSTTSKYDTLCFQPEALFER